MNELRDSVIFILLASVLSTYQMFDVLLSRTYHLTEDTRVTKLVADCELWDILPPSQPSRTLVLACPRVDAIRLWPLPVQQPWEEGTQILARYVGCAHIEWLGIELVTPMMGRNAWFFGYLSKITNR